MLIMGDASLFFKMAQMTKILTHKGPLDKIEFVEKLVEPHDWNNLFEVTKRLIYCYLHTCNKMSKFVVEEMRPTGKFDAV